MLSDRCYQLLTAAVDGELDGREQRAVETLLRESAEARRFYRQLKDDSDALKNLPRAKLPPHFGAQLLQKLSPLIHAEPSSRQDGLARRLPVWANVAAAAAVLLAISLGTYLVMELSEQEQPVVKNQNPPQAPLPSSPRVPEPPAIARNGDDSGKMKDPEQLPVPRGEVIVDAGSPKAVDPGTQDALTAPPRPSYDRLFKVEPPKLPPILAVRDLDQDGARQKLFDVLKKNGGVHLDLFCKDTNRAFERLQTAFAGQRLLIDAVAQERLQRKLKTHYVFYTEALTAEQIQAILHSLAADERRAAAKKEPQFDKLVANPLSANSIKTLSMLLGVDPKWLQSKPKASAPIDPTKPLSDSTAESLARSLKSGGSRSERLVLVLPYNPIRPNPAASKEVRQFLESVRHRKPGTQPLLLVLRTAE